MFNASVQGGNYHRHHISSNHDFMTVPHSNVNIPLQATQKFLEIVNKVRARKNAGPITWKTAVKFLMARKFDVDR